MLTQGADPNLADRQGRTALMGAAFQGDEAATQLLLDTPGIDLNLQNGAGQTAAMYAALFDRQALLARYLPHGADLSIKDVRGNDAASLARGQGNETLAQWIEQHKRP